MVRRQADDRRPAVGQRAEVCFAALERVFGLDGTLAKTPVGVGDQDRGEDRRLHLRPLRQPPPGTTAGAQLGA